MIDCPYCHRRHGTKRLGAVSIAMCEPDDAGGRVTIEPGRCRWFKWIGGSWCEGCGDAPTAHDGLEWLAFDADAGPFDVAEVIHVRWEDYGPGRELNVPLFSLTFGDPAAQLGRR